MDFFPASTDAPHVDEKIAIRFCELCNWTYEVWVTHKCLFDDNAEPSNNIGRLPYFTSRLATITQEYALHQIAKLHDPWKQRKDINLTISYIVECDAWDEQKPIVEEIAARLDELHQHILPARNRILSHHDFDTTIRNATLGSFPADADDNYFASLQELVDAVHGRWIGGPYPFPEFAKTDALEFLRLLERIPPNRHGMR